MLMCQGGSAGVVVVVPSPPVVGDTADATDNGAPYTQWGKILFHALRLYLDCVYYVATNLFRHWGWFCSLFLQGVNAP